MSLLCKSLGQSRGHSGIAGEQGPAGLERLYDVLLRLPPPREPLFTRKPRISGYFNTDDIVQTILDQISDLPKLSPRGSMATSSSFRDPFTRLPFELREKIATLLPTQDFYHLRQASRSLTPIFDDSRFWKSRFWKDGDRGFLHFPSAVEKPVDWRSLYRATAKAEDRFGMTLKVWEVIQWIKDTLRRVPCAQMAQRPLDFYGRALQYYHNDSCAKGQRIERAEIPVNLTHIAVSMVSGPEIHDRQRYIKQVLPPGQPATEITALEFTNTNGSRETIGSRDPMARTVTAEKLSEELNRKERKEMIGRIKNQTPGLVSPFDHHGVRVVFDARSFKGFHIRYDSHGISSIGVLQREAASSPFALRLKNGLLLAPSPYVCGYDADSSTMFDMDMDRVVEVVGTFDVRSLSSTYSRSTTCTTHGLTAE
ncbi:hypothetical protein BJX76DRAFT_360219 [Aspergillus varians]